MSYVDTDTNIDIDASLVKNLHNDSLSWMYWTDSGPKKQNRYQIWHGFRSDPLIVLKHDATDAFRNLVAILSVTLTSSVSDQY